MTDFAELYRTVRSSLLSRRAFSISCFVHSKRNCLSSKRWCCNSKRFCSSSATSESVYTTSADGVGWNTEVSYYYNNCLERSREVIQLLRVCDVMTASNGASKRPAIFSKFFECRLLKVRKPFFGLIFHVLPDCLVFKLFGSGVWLTKC